MTDPVQQLEAHEPLASYREAYQLRIELAEMLAPGEGATLPTDNGHIIKAVATLMGRKGRLQPSVEWMEGYRAGMAEREAGHANHDVHPDAVAEAASRLLSSARLFARDYGLTTRQALELMQTATFDPREVLR